MDVLTPLIAIGMVALLAAVALFGRQSVERVGDRLRASLRVIICLVLIAQGAMMLGSNAPMAQMWAARAFGALQLGAAALYLVQPGNWTLGTLEVVWGTGGVVGIVIRFFSIPDADTAAFAAGLLFAIVVKLAVAGDGVRRLVQSNKRFNQGSTDTPSNSDESDPENRHLRLTSRAPLSAAARRLRMVCALPSASAPLATEVQGTWPGKPPVPRQQPARPLRRPRDPGLNPPGTRPGLPWDIRARLKAPLSAAEQAHADG